MIGSRALVEDICKKTLAEFGVERLRALCEAGGAQPISGQICQLFARLVYPWGNLPIGASPPCRSAIADDEAPYEFSIALSGGPPELQFYVEPLGQPPTLASNMQVGRLLLRTIAADLEAPLGRLEEVEDLFFPSNPSGTFTIWLGISCAEGRAPRLKVYLNPQVQGPSQASRVVDEAMRRLGFAEPWSKVSRGLCSGPHRTDELGIVSLDLSQEQSARVKVYLRHHGASIEQIDAFAREGRGYVARDAHLFYRALAHDDGPFLRKPAISEVAFANPGTRDPPERTLEFPMGKYVGNDGLASQRIVQCMKAFGVPHERYLAAVRAFAVHPLEESWGMHAHVTLKRLNGLPRIGVYLASNAYPSRGDA